MKRGFLPLSRYPAALTTTPRASDQLLWVLHWNSANKLGLAGVLVQDAQFIHRAPAYRVAEGVEDGGSSYTRGRIAQLGGTMSQHRLERSLALVRMTKGLCT